MKTLLALLLLSSVAVAQPKLKVDPMKDPAKTYAVRIDEADTVDGAADAKVTMVDTFDYQCPYCEKTRPTIEGLKAKYGNDLRIVYKPFVVHPTKAMGPAVGACAATRQHKFAAYDAAAWAAFKTNKLDNDATAIATAAKLDMAQFKKDQAVCDAYVKRSMGDMQMFGVNAIPTFYINGRIFTGAQPQEKFEALIDEELKKAGDRLAGAKADRYYQQYVVDKGEKGSLPRPANPCGGSQIVKPRGNPCGGKMPPPSPPFNPCGG